MSYNSTYMSSEQQAKVQNQKRFGNSLPMAQKRWLKKVLRKCQEFLNKMKEDSKAVIILDEPYHKIYSIAYEIYKNDGCSLDKWLSQSNNENNEKYETKEVSISTYKEQFKNMLSLDIWVDKLLEWQRNDYKLEMPAREQVDPLSWNKVLKSKLNQVILEESMPTPPPKQEVNVHHDTSN